MCRHPGSDVMINFCIFGLLPLVLFFSSRLRKLFFPEEFESEAIDAEVQTEADPEPGLHEAADGIDDEVGKDDAGVRVDAQGDDGGGRSDHLGGDKGEADVKAGQGGE